MTLYIYRVGWTYLARNPITRSKSIKIPSCIRIPLGPVDPTGQTGRLLPDRLQRLTGQTARAYRSDRSVLSNANFGRQQVDNDLSHEKHLIPPAPHVMHFFLKKACNAIAGPFLLGVMSCRFFCQLDVTFAFSLTSVNAYCLVCISSGLIHGTSI